MKCASAIVDHTPYFRIPACDRQISGPTSAHSQLDGHAYVCDMYQPASPGYAQYMSCPIASVFPIYYHRYMREVHDVSAQNNGKDSSLKLQFTKLSILHASMPTNRYSIRWQRTGKDETIEGEEARTLRKSEYAEHVNA